MTKWIALSALLFSSASFAGVNSPYFDNRQGNQATRIGQGVANGSLTAWETAKLANQQRVIRKTERRFESDGHLGVYEKVTLNRMQNRASGSIYRQKHDRQRRW